MAPQAPSEPTDDDIQTETDHIIREFSEETVRRAAGLAQSTNMSVEDILEEAKLIMAPAVARLKRHRKKTAWDIAMREGKHTVDTEIVKPVAGLGYQGRAGFDGQYLKEVKKNYDDPTKRAEYEKTATEENEREYLPSIQTIAGKQKKLLRELHLLAKEAADQEINLIVMAVPSNSNINGFIFRSSGLGEAFYDLLTEGSGAYERFMALCRGGALLRKAKEIALNKKVESSDGRDALRSTVTELIRTKINEHTSNKFGELVKIPRMKGALTAELERRKLRWKTPPDWPHDLVGIEQLITSRAVNDLKKVKEAFEDGSLALT